MKDFILQEKTTALEGCNHANRHTCENNRKVCHSVLVSHDEITPNRSFKGLIGTLPSGLEGRAKITKIKCSYRKSIGHHSL